MTHDTSVEQGTSAAGISVLRKRRKPLVPVEQRHLILIVEDDPEMRELLSEALGRCLYDIVAVGDGNEALTWLGPAVLWGKGERIPSLIVSDIRLRNFSGLEILESMRRATHPVPVILITGFGDAEVHATAHRLGAARVLDKPFPMYELLAAVAVALRRPPEGGPTGGDDFVW